VTHEYSPDDIANHWITYGTTTMMEFFIFVVLLQRQVLLFQCYEVILTFV